MAVNKNKITTLAQKYTAKGQFEKAIGEYRKLVKADPNDIRTWLKMGDLYTRMGARKEATETYLKVAEHYRKSDFHLKAVAVYKQVLKLDPTLIDVYELLGDAYMSLGLTSDALIQYEQLADMYQRAERSDRMIAVLTRMAQIDPQNISTRLRIAEYYSKEGESEAAVEHFTVACTHLKEQGRTDDYIKVAERLLYHSQDLVEMARDVAALYLEKGQTKRALAKLQLCFSKEPRNVETLELLARAFVGLNQPDKAVSVYLEISNIFDEQGNTAERDRVLRVVLENDPENQVALEALGEAPAARVEAQPDFDDDGLPSPALAASGVMQGEVTGVGEPAEEEPEELSDEAAAARAEKILGEAEVLIKYGLLDRARDHIGKIFEFDYYNLDARERMKDVLLDAGDQEGALEQLFVLAEGFREEQPEGSVYFLHQVLAADPYNRRARDFISEIGGILPEGLPALDDEQSVDPGDLLDDDFDAVAEDEVVEDSGQDVDLIDETVDSFDVDIPSIDEVPYVTGDNELTELDLEGDDEWEPESEPEPEPEVLQLDEDEVLEGVEDLDDDAYEVVEEPKPVASGSTAAPPPPVRSVAPPPKRTVPPPPRPGDARQESKPSAAPPRSPVLSERPQSKSVPPPASQPAPQPVLDDDAPDIAEELEEIEFFMSQGLEDEAKGIVEGLLVSFPDDPRVRELEKKVLGVNAHEEVTAVKSFDFDALAEDLEEITNDEVVSEIDEVFTQFKAGVEKQVSQTDFATHYDLGVAYKEMGLFDDAISEFKIASGDPTRGATAQMMIGMCQVGAGKIDEAVATFQAGMETPGLEQEGKLALMYELGKAYEVAGKGDDAIGVYNQILMEDPGFADVVDRIDVLEDGGIPGGGQSVFS